MNETLQNYKKVIKYGKDYKRLVIIQIVCSIIRIITCVGLPLLAAQQIVCFTSNEWEQLIYISAIYLLLASFNQLIIAITKIRLNIFRKESQKNIQIRLGKEIVSITQNDIDDNSSGMFVQRIINDTDKMSKVYGYGIKLIQDVSIGIGTFLAIFILNPLVFIYYVLATSILSGLYAIKTKKEGKKEKEYRDQTEKVSGITSEVVRGTRDIKMLNAENGLLNILKTYIEKQNQKKSDTYLIDVKYGKLISILETFLEFGLIIMLIYLLKNGTIEVAIAIALYNYRSNILINFMGKVSELLITLKDFNISCDRIFSIIDNNIFEKERFGHKHLGKVDGNFEFQNVSFGYNKSKRVLNNINFKINAGEMIGLVGKSGAGKTTIFNLICKLYSADSGKILIENEEINDLDKDSIRGNISIISQNPYIFNLSIRDNLKIVKEDLTDDEMFEACKLACLDEFISNLPQGYDTIVGEGGITLSGGQKQRLAIARAFVQKTKIILFDEATSNLDNETQAEIQKAIANLKKEYTIIIIAHRLSTIVNCDRIMVLENGKIIDKGTHEELLNRNETYKNLYQVEILK